MKKFLVAATLLAMMTPVAFAADAATVNVSSLNVRADADLTADLVGKLSQGTEIQVEGKVLKDTWCRITFKTKEAYVACQYLTFGKATTAPAATTPAASTGTTMAPTLTFPLARVVAVPTLNVRATASITGDLLGKMTMGTSVSILEKSKDNWCRIEYTGKVAWLACAYLAKGEDMPTATATTPETTQPTTTSTGTTMAPTMPATIAPVVTVDASGCTWTEKDFGAMTMQVAKCATGTQYNFGVRGNAVYKFTTSIDTPAGAPVLELYAKGEDEPIMDAVMSLVSGTIPQEEQGKCVVRKAASTLKDATKELYQLAPTADYQKVIDARRSNETNVTACGAYGQSNIPQYFEYHPGESKTIFAFARVDGSFDVNSIKIR